MNVHLEYSGILMTWGRCKTLFYSATTLFVVVAVVHWMKTGLTQPSRAVKE